MSIIFDIGKKKIGSIQKKKLTLYRTRGLDSKGKKFYNTSKKLFGDVYYFDEKNNLYKYHIDKNGNEYGTSVRKSRLNLDLRDLKGNKI